MIGSKVSAILMKECFFLLAELHREGHFKPKSLGASSVKRCGANGAHHR